MAAPGGSGIVAPAAADGSHSTVSPAAPSMAPLQPQTGGAIPAGPSPPPPSDLPPHSDNVDEELRRVNLALQAVFSASAAPPPASASSSAHPPFKPDPSNLGRLDVADRYLTSFQRSPVAWMVSDRILQLPDGAAPDAALAQRRFFAAQTLHAKCRSDAHQLPPASLPPLRDSLIGHLTRFACGTPGTAAAPSSPPAPRALVTRLAMASAALAVQMRWTTVVTDVLETMLRPHPELAPAVLELLRSLPEECASDRLFLPDENVRYEFRDRLRDSSGSVMDFLMRYAGGSIDATGPGAAAAGMPVATEAEKLRREEDIYLAFHVWIRYVPIPPSVLCSSPLVECAFRSLGRPDLFEVAVDVIVEIVRMYPSHIDSHGELVHRMIPLVMALGNSPQPGTVGSPCSPFDVALRDDDEDSLRGYCRIFTEMGESYMSLILSAEELNQEALVELVLRCSAIPDHEVAAITLHFWYAFVNGLETIEPYEFRQHMIDHYAPILVRLLSVCCDLLRYPPDIDQLKDDRVDDIHRNRFYVADTVEDCCRLLGGDTVLRNVGARLKEQCDRVASLPGDRQEWQGIESCLFAIQSVCQYTPNDENKVLPFAMNLITQLPPDVSLLRYTASQTVGRYAAWLGVHPEYLQPLMPYLAQGLSMPKCATAAAIAIKELCECSNNQVLMGDPVLQLYDGIVQAQQQQQQQQQQSGAVAPASLILDLRDELEILEGVCKAVSRQLATHTSTPEEATTYLSRIVQPIGARLTLYVSPAGNGTPRQINAELERLTVIVRFLNLPRSGSSTPTAQQPEPVHPTMDIITQSWPLLDAIGRQYPTDTNLAEKMCRLHKHALRGCGPRTYAPLLDSLIDQLVRNFETSLLSPYLYAASICITEFGRDERLHPRLFDMISRMSTASFGVLRRPEDFTTHPDVVEELFYLMGRAMTYCPEPLVKSPLLGSLLRCATVGMQLDHKDANRGTMNFLESTVSYGLDVTGEECKSALQSAIVSEGPGVVANLARALMGDLPAYAVDAGSGSIAGILWKMNCLCHELLLQWIGPALATSPEQARAEFSASLTGRVPREDFTTSVRAFRAACERNRKLLGGVS